MILGAWSMWIDHLRDLATLGAGAVTLWGVVWGSRLMRTVRLVAREFSPNGGGSMRDMLEDTRRGVCVLTEAYRWTWDVSEKAVFEADAHGQWVHASRGLCEMLGYERAELLGNGWLAAVIAAERTKVAEGWMNSVAQGYPWSARCAFLNPRTSSAVVMHILVRQVQQPPRDGKQPRPLHHLGEMTRIEPADSP